MHYMPRIIISGFAFESSDWGVVPVVQAVKRSDWWRGGFVRQQPCTKS